MKKNTRDMEDINKLKQEQKELKEKLLELIDYINSEEYFSLDENKKQLLSTQRLGMETYLSSLSMRLYNEGSCYIGNIIPLIMMSILSYPGSLFGSGNTDELKKLIEEQEQKPEKQPNKIK